MRGFATSGGVVLPVLLRAARTGHKVSGGGGGGGIGCVAFFRRFFTMAAIKTVIESARSDVDGNSAQTASSDGQEGSEGDRGSEAIFKAAGRPPAHGCPRSELYAAAPRTTAFPNAPQAR